MKIHERRRIFALLDGRISERSRRALERHLDGCDDCREYLDSVRRSREVLSGLGEERPDIVWARVDAAVEREARTPAAAPARARALWIMGPALAAATAVLLFVLVRPLLGPHGGGSAQPGQSNPAVMADQTLLDSLPGSGRFTMLGEGTRWKRPGLGWQEADLATEITEGTDLETPDRAVASVQLAPMSGVRIEPGTRATFSTIRRDAVLIDLEDGLLSVSVSPGSGLRDVRVRTSQAEIVATGTILSVEGRGPSTRVVVARGSVAVRSAASAEVRTLFAPAALTLADAGPGEAQAGGDEEGKQEIQRLRVLHFNFFESEPPGASVAFEPGSDAGRVTVSIGDRLAGLAPLTMVTAEGTDAATLAFEDGSTLATPFKVASGSTTIVSFTPPVIKTEPARGKAKATSKEAAEGAVDQGIAAGSGVTPAAQNTGTLDPMIVKLVMKKQQGELRDCYQKYLAKQTGAGAVKARIRFTIGADGKVTKASAKTSVDDSTLESCLASVTSSLAFPPPDGGSVEFEYPISFSPQ